MHRNSQVRFGAKSSWAVVAVTAFMLSACTVGPNYHWPVVQTPTAFHGADESQQAAQTESFADLPWWQVFHDSTPPPAGWLAAIH
jgi:outer membrane protein, multidrug efflux system